MLWLFAQVWVWLLVAVLVGVLVGWLFWARPLNREIVGLRSDRDAATPRTAA